MKIYGEKRCQWKAEAASAENSAEKAADGLRRSELRVDRVECRDRQRVEAVAPAFLTSPLWAFGAAVLARALWPFGREVALHVQASRAISIAGLH